MSSSYKCMYVIPKEMYQRLKASSSTSSQSSLNSVSSQSQITPPPPSSGAALVCGKNFKHPNILAHHRKSHVDGYQCNICKSVFNHQQELHKHLVQHAADTVKKYDDDDEDVTNPKQAKVEDKGMESAAAPPPILHYPICKKPSKHKRNLARHIKSHDRREV